MAGDAMAGRGGLVAAGAAELTALAQEPERLGTNGGVAQARELAGRLPVMVERIWAQVALLRGAD